MEKEKIRHITASASTFDQFEKMADSFGLTNKGLLEAMVKYFQLTKADPRDAKADNPTDAIKALDKRLIGFIKEQEKKTLAPIKEAVLELASTEGVPRMKELRTINIQLKSIMKHFKIE